MTMKKRLAAILLAATMATGMAQTCLPVQTAVTAEAKEKGRKLTQNEKKARNWILARENAVIKKETKAAQKEYDSTEKTAADISKKYLNKEIKDVKKIINKTPSKYDTSLGYSDSTRSVTLNGITDHVFNPLVTIDHSKRDKKVEKTIRTKIKRLGNKYTKLATEEFIKTDPDMTQEKYEKLSKKGTPSSADRIIRAYEKRMIKALQEYIKRGPVCGVSVDSMELEKRKITVTTEHTSFTVKPGIKIDKTKLSSTSSGTETTDEDNMLTEQETPEFDSTTLSGASVKASIRQVFSNRPIIVLVHTLAEGDFAGTSSSIDTFEANVNKGRSGDDAIVGKFQGNELSDAGPVERAVRVYPAAGKTLKLDSNTGIGTSDPIFMDYNAIAEEGKVSLNEKGKYIYDADFVVNKKKSSMAYNTMMSYMDVQGSPEYIDDHSDFSSDIIWDKDGRAVGLVFTEMNSTLRNGGLS